MGCRASSDSVPQARAVIFPSLASFPLHQGSMLLSASPISSLLGMFERSYQLISYREGKGSVAETPKFTNEVQHFLYKVLRWDKNMNSFRWNNVARLPGIAKPGKQSAKSRQLWIARHRL